MDVFKSKIDGWIVVCLVLSVIACFMGASVMLKIGGTGNYVLAAFILILGAGFPLWLLVSTKYVVDSENLQIISGPFSWNIPIQSIISVQEIQNAITSPALSFDRVEIKYGEDKVIYVSPADKRVFLQKLDGKKLTDKGGDDLKQTEGKISKNKTKKTRKSHNK